MNALMFLKRLFNSILVIFLIPLFAIELVIYAMNESVVLISPLSDRVSNFIEKNGGLF